MRVFRLTLLALVLLAPAFRALAAQPILKITTPEKTVTFTAEEFAALPHTEVKAEAMHEQEPRRYSGVAMRELLARVGAPLGENFRGPSLAMGVVVRCAAAHRLSRRQTRRAFGAAGRVARAGLAREAVKRSWATLLVAVAFLVGATSG